MPKTLAALLFVSAFAHAQNPLMQAYLPRYNTMKQNLLEAAEAMPSDHYAFKLSPSQRAFGEWVDHTVLLMHSSCAQMRGSTAPVDHSKHAGSLDKSQLVSALKEAAANCDTVLKEMTDTAALNGPVNPMLGLLTNLSSHYGNMVGYLRAKGVVPPSTARAQKR